MKTTKAAKAVLKIVARPLAVLRRRAPLVPVIRLAGVIGRVGPTRAGMSLSGMAGIIERAFSQRGAVGVALVINSPGGSPVQSSLLHGRIRALAEEKKLPVTAFIEDVGASGGYWLACAGDEIYADASSIVGSIGVVSAGFGFVEAIARLGIERRVHAAGENKSMLDPFRPEDPKDLKRLKAIHTELHGNFKALVRARRGDKLSGPEKEIFSGAFWSASRAQEFGLIDGIGELRATMRARHGDKTRFKVFADRPPFFRRRLGLAGTDARDSACDWARDWADGAIAAVEDRALWSRFGL